MPNIHFESFSDSLSRLPDLIQSIPDILRNPAANPLMATVLLGVVLVLLLIIVLSVLLVIMRPSAEEEALLSYEGGEEDAEPLSEEERAALKRAEALQRRGTALTITSVIILVGLVVWIVGGMTSARSDVCSSCHPDTKHASAKGQDPHADVACVDCHEGGGRFARISVNVATRVEHVVFARTNADAARAFGRPAASDACFACHRSQIEGTFYDSKRGVKVAHAEPIAAGAECVDCHALKSGVVNATTVGMSPCLRCHDGKRARAECSVCHVGDPSRAIKPKTALGDMAMAQVPNPQCGGCHKDMSKCTACHGISMPHSAVFKYYGHARQGALDIWYNNSKTCTKCHYSGHNDCVQEGCHLVPVPSGHPNPAWAKLHQNTSWLTGMQGGCACHEWNPYDHDGMTYCQICHPVKPKNARR